MIVKMINKKDNAWIPSLKQFLEILKQSGLELKEGQEKYIEEKLLKNKDKEKSDCWFFNIKFKIEVKSSEGYDKCDIRIIKNRVVEDDRCTGCIIMSSDTDIVNDMNFDYNLV